MRQNPPGIPPMSYFYSGDGSKKTFTGDMESRTMSIVRPNSGESDQRQITFRQYLDFIRRFLLSRWGDFIEVLEQKIGETVESVSEIEIVAEKSGSDYHPASVRFKLNNRPMVLVANVAVNSRGRSCLRQDFELMSYFHKMGNGNFVPRPFLISSPSELAEAESNDSMAMFLAEWFDGYYEFHLTRSTNSEEPYVELWDTDNGLKALSGLQTEEVFRQTAFILTNYFDLNDYREIFPWHHAAGDFVAKLGANVDVRLITVRQYAPRIQSDKDFILDSYEAALLFLCNLTIRNRVDRLDGIGEMVWAPANILSATIRGFFQSLDCRQKSGALNAGFSNRLRAICRKLDLIAWTQLYDGTFESFNEQAPDHGVIERNLPDHIFEVSQIFSKM